MSLSLKRSNWISAIILLLIVAIALHGFGIEPLEKVSENIDGDILLLIIYVLAALVFSFLCSVAEALLLSITQPFIEGKKEKQPKLAKRLKQIEQDNIERSLAAILTLSTTLLHIRLVQSVPEVKRKIFLEAPGLAYSRV